MVRLTQKQIEMLPDFYKKQINDHGHKSSPSSQNFSVEGLDKKNKPKNKPVSQDYLYQFAVKRWPDIKKEFKAIPDRRFKIDLAFPDIKLGIEVEGWQFHGQYKRSHQNDCRRNNVLVANGWTIMRFFHGEIMRDITSVLEIIQVEHDRRHLFLKTLTTEQVKLWLNPTK